MPRIGAMVVSSWRRRSRIIVHQSDSSSDSDNEIELNSSHSSERSFRSASANRRSSSLESQASESPQPQVDSDSSNSINNWGAGSEHENSPVVSSDSSNDSESSILNNNNSDSNLSIYGSSDSDREDRHLVLDSPDSPDNNPSSGNPAGWDFDDSLFDYDASNHYHPTPPNRSPTFLPDGLRSPSPTSFMFPNPTPPRGPRPTIGLNLGNRAESETDSDNSLLNFSPPSSPGSRLSGDSDRQSIESHASHSEDNLERVFGYVVSRASLSFDSAGNSPLPTSSASSSTGNHSTETAASSSSVAAAAMNGASTSTSSSVPFECSVCLEGLDGPASIDTDAPGPSNEQNHDAPGPVTAHIRLVGIMRVASTARISTGGRAGRPPVGARQRARGTVNDENASLTDVVATHCGHLYHQVCLLKWFRQQGKRTCPSCRKTVPPSKLIRLYPNLSKDAGGTSSVYQVPSVTVGGSNTNLNAPSTSTSDSNTNTASSGGRCANATCQDFKDIHNTLINDYNDLQERFNDLRDNDALKEAQISSLEEDNTRKENEIAQLKRELEGSRERVSASTSSRAKRARR